MCRNGENRNGASMTIEETIDKVKVAGPATAGANREIASQLSIGTGGEGCDLLVTDVNPLNSFLSLYLVDYSIEGIADYSVDSLDPCRGQSGDQVFCDSGHDVLLILVIESTMVAR
jgi:hypothetical protein